MLCRVAATKVIPFITIVQIIFWCFWIIGSILRYFENRILLKPVLGVVASVAHFIRGIKHDFPFINIRMVPREVLKTEGDARGFQPSRGTLRMSMNDKIIFDRYYCINSTKHCENEENIAALYF